MCKSIFVPRRINGCVNLFNGQCGDGTCCPGDSNVSATYHRSGMFDMLFSSVVGVGGELEDYFFLCPYWFGVKLLSCCPYIAQTCGGRFCCNSDAICCGNPPRGCCEAGMVCCPNTCCGEGESCCGDLCCIGGTKCCPDACKLFWDSLLSDRLTSLMIMKVVRMVPNVLEMDNVGL